MSEKQTATLDDVPFHAEMLCYVETISYDFEHRGGQVWISSGGCTDMGGCIGFFKKIDPNVTRIRTFSDERPDTSYFKNDAGQWEAR
jgi:hypothetical protein